MDVYGQALASRENYYHSGAHYSAPEPARMPSESTMQQFAHNRGLFDAEEEYLSRGDFGLHVAAESWQHEARHEFSGHRFADQELTDSASYSSYGRDDQYQSMRLRRSAQCSWFEHDLMYLNASLKAANHVANLYSELLQTRQRAERPRRTYLAPATSASAVDRSRFKDVACRWFSQGKCTHGASCKFSHDKDAPLTLDAAGQM
eukprot:TRINITY_DN57156_c0_g1_i1.p1 TRINITY_DN57156_c0_g1~~TRINITY_DN57156_c0_g1_i1.p1  ORF type:complete len:204 (-),score=24.85 TRINITY_DN57156_c0_g1_i1:221-832(-)